jgi:uncharacterized protein YcfJ
MNAMRHLRTIGLAGALGLSACAAIPPSGPSLLALPREGKNYETFQREDAYCMSVAAQQAQPAPQAGVNPIAGGAAIGTLGGAAAGALIGAATGNAGAGAAIGAGTGLAAGTVVGANNANTTSYGLQQRYDTVYAQCTASYGNRIEAPAPRFAAAPFYPGPYYYGAPYPYFGPPAVGLSFGFGPRYYGRGWGHRRW